jgi:hypothetical protein
VGKPEKFLRADHHRGCGEFNSIANIIFFSEQVDDINISWFV